MDAKEISKAVIKRLPRYYRYLGELMEEKVERISSNDLSKKMHVTASQIRQDLNNFGGFGQQGYGYNIHELRLKISEILGLDRSYTMAIVGAGKIGQAILSYDGFRSMDFHITAIFDTDPELIGRRVRDITIYDAANIREVLTASPVDVGVVAVPEASAQWVCDMLIGCGVRAIWNFAPIDLNVGRDVAINNVHLSDSLMVLTYSMRHTRGGDK